MGELLVSGRVYHPKMEFVCFFFRFAMLASSGVKRCKRSRTCLEMGCFCRSKQKQHIFWTESVGVT